MSLNQISLRKKFALTILISGAFAAFASDTKATTYYWDNDGTTAGFGIAAGTWAAPTTGDATQGWSTSATGVLLPGNVTTLNTTAANDILNFGNTTTGLGAGTISVTGTVNASSLVFASGSGNIVLSGGTITLRTAGAITVNNTTDTINSVLAGAATSFAKVGTGTLILTEANTYTGSTLINAGTLDLGGGTANGSLASTVLTLGGGQLNYTRTGNTTQSFTTTNINVLTNSAITVAIGNTLNLGTVARASRAWLDFSTTGAGTVAADLASNVNGIMPGFTFGDSWAVANGAGMAITGLAGGSYTSTATAGTTGSNYTNNNIDVDNSAGALDAAITANSLRFSAANANTLTLTGTTNVIASGGILVGSGVGGNVSTITGGTLAGIDGKDLIVIQNNPAAKLTVASIIANNTTTTGLTKIGVGTLELNGDNTYTGLTNVTNGTLTLSGNRTATSGLFTIGSAGTTATLNLQADLPISAGNFFIGSGVGSTGIVNQTAGSVSTAAGTNIFFGSFGTTTNPVTSSYNLSGGTLGSSLVNWAVSQGVNSFSQNTFNLSNGTLNLQAGTLQLGRIARNDVVDTTNTFNQTGGTANVGTLYVGGNTTATVGGTTGNVDGILNLTGGTFVAANFSSIALGNGNDGTINIGGTADVTLPAFPTARGVGSTATINFDGGILKPLIASATYMGGLDNAFIKAGGAAFDTTNGSITITQPLLTHGVSLGGGLTKLGSNTLTLTGTNTYTGPTTVSAGTLAITGTGTLGTGNIIVNGILDIAGITPADYTLGMAQVLSGGGTINTTGKTLNVNGIIAPGNSIGNLSFTGALTINGNYLLETGAGSQADLVTVAGALTLGGSSFLDLDSLSTLVSSETYIIAGYSTLTGTFGTIDTAISTTHTVDYNFSGLNQIALVPTVIPEPSTLVLGGMALLGFAGVRLRKRRLAK